MEVMDNLFDHDYKLRNSLVGFLAYGASNCRRFREETFDEIVDLAFVLEMKVHANGKCWGLVHDEQNVDLTKFLERCECRSNMGVLM
mmetsp:Transcript_4096/g.4224  ORF Transcript_4096/g.4224 Transcript_4096/m.4224 type:complete len:87 (+) Transcript_4096:91-351(+)